MDGDILTSGNATTPAWKLETEERRPRTNSVGDRGPVTAPGARQRGATPRSRRGVACDRFTSSENIQVWAVDGHRGVQPSQKGAHEFEQFPFSIRAVNNRQFSESELGNLLSGRMLPVRLFHRCPVPECSIISPVIIAPVALKPAETGETNRIL